MADTLDRGLYVEDVELEHGWSARTPLDDTAARRAVVALTESTATPSRCMGARELRTADLVATDLDRSAGYWNAAVIQRPIPDGRWGEVLADLDRFTAQSTAPRNIDLWSPFPTVDLRRYGWELCGHPVAMWRSPAPRPAPPHGELAVHRVGDRHALDQWRNGAVEWFPLSVDGESLLTEEILDDPDIHLFLGTIDHQPVAVSSTVITSGTNAIPFVATHPDARRRGFGEAVTWAATLVRPDLPAVLLASDDGRPVYESMGYLPLQRWTMWTRHVSGPESD